MTRRIVEEVYSCKGQFTSNGSLKDCNISINSNFLRISMVDEEVCRHYKDIEDLKINYRIEEKRKFLFVTRIYHITFTINGDKLPEVIIGESDYREMIEVVEEYKRYIIKENEFKNEFLENYNLIQDFFWWCKSESDIIQENFNTKNNQNIFIYLIKDMYSKIGKSKSNNEVILIFKSRTYIKEIMDKTIIYSLRWDNGDLISEDVLTQLYNNVFRVLDISESYVYEYYKFQIPIDYGPETDYNKIINEFTGFNFMFSIAFSFIRLLILSRNKNNFINNKELYQMYLNLSKDKNIDNIYIVQKLYPLYIEFYEDTFEEKLSVEDFYSFINLLNKHVEEDDLILSIYVDDINRVNNIIEEKVMNIDENLYDGIFNVLKDFLLDIDKSRFFEIIGTIYELEDLKSIYTLFYNLMFKHIYERVPVGVFYKLMEKESSNLIKILCKDHTSKILKQEKERLLEGNMNKEDDYIKDKYSFNNIITGYDFEEYLKGIFEGLGYVANVTKGSNDQGADLLIEKDGETTVVQAKYYSSTVGNKAVQEVVSAIAYYDADNGMVVTNNSFTKSAIALAEANDIKLIDGEGLEGIRDVLIGGTI